MNKEYQVNIRVKIANWFMSRLIAWDLAPERFQILSVSGRKTGKTYRLPVSLVIEDGQRWLVSPYGEPNWIKNARAAGKVGISRAGMTTVWNLEELDPAQSAPVLKKYLKQNSIVQPYFEAVPADSLKAFEKEAPDHPVFLLQEGTADDARS